MDYEAKFRSAIDTVRDEGRYRIFADLKRRRGAYPRADYVADMATGQGREITVWCSNDYLGMSQHPAVIEAMHDAIDKVGAGSGGTRNIAGTTHYHVELEAEIADLHAKQSALLFTSAFVANEATLSTIVKLIPGTVIFSDEKNQLSMQLVTEAADQDKRKLFVDNIDVHFLVPLLPYLHKPQLGVCRTYPANFAKLSCE